MTVRRLLTSAAFALAAALPAGAAAVHAAPGLAVDYVIYVGGTRVGAMTLKARVEPERYQIETELKTEEVADATEEGTLNLFAAGARDDAGLTPQIYTSDYVNTKGQSRQVQITFNQQGPASVLSLPKPTNPPQPLSDFHKRGALDPVSAMLAITDARGEAPCGKPLPVFDGWRRFDIQLGYKGETQMDGGDDGYKGTAYKCEGRLVPVAGYSADAMREMREEAETVELWLADAAGEGLLVPVRIIAPTPFGGAVIRSTDIREYNEGG